MSQENGEIVQRAYEAFARGDGDAALRDLDVEVEVYPPKGFPGAASFHGRKAFRAYVERWLESWDEYRMTPEEFIEAGDQVLVIYGAVGRRQGSGVEVESRFGHVWTILDGNAVRIEMFSTPAEALDPNDAAWPGDGQYLFAVGGISDAKYITGPTYLLNWGITTTDKLDFKRVRAEAIAFTEEILRLARTPADQLRTYTF